MKKTSSRIGIAILALLSLANVPSVLTGDGEHPPVAIAAALTVVGVVGCVLAVLAWRGNRLALAGLVAISAVSALSAVPAFAQDGVPPALKLVVAVTIAVTVVAIGLVLPALPGRRAGVTA